MTIAELQEIRLVTGDIAFKGLKRCGCCCALMPKDALLDVEMARDGKACAACAALLVKEPCGRCMELTPPDDLHDVSDIEPVIRGKACGGCAHELAEAAHVGHEACHCSQCGRRRQIDAWGVWVTQ